ncbi:MAG: transposase, partial [Bacteroidaceae bacterium]
KWTEKQETRAKLLFSLYPDLSEAYGLAQHLRAIFNKRSTKDIARLNLARWYDRVNNAGFKSFHIIAATIYEHHDEILNFFNNRATNASAESLNSKIKAFRAQLHGVTDKKFFLYRIGLIFG